MTTYTYTDKAQLVFEPKVSITSAVLNLEVQTATGCPNLPVPDGDDVMDNTVRPVGSSTIVNIRVLDDGANAMTVSATGTTWTTSGGVTESDLAIPTTEGVSTTFALTIETGTGATLKRRQQNVIIRHRPVAV